MPPILLLLAGLFVVGLAAGCSAGARVVYPGDGQLVIVDIDPDLDKCPVTLDGGSKTTIGAMIRNAIRYWDVAGAHLRTVDQLLPTESPAGAMHLLVHGDPSTDAGTALDATKRDAQFNYSTGDVQLFISRWNTNNVGTVSYWYHVMAIAHEIGHAIGLDHVSDPAAVMYPDYTDLNARSNLAAADMAEWARVWGHVESAAH